MYVMSFCSHSFIYLFIYLFINFSFLLSRLLSIEYGLILTSVKKKYFLKSLDKVIYNLTLRTDLTDPKYNQLKDLKTLGQNDSSSSTHVCSHSDSFATIKPFFLFFSSGIWRKYVI